MNDIVKYDKFEKVFLNNKVSNLYEKIYQNYSSTHKKNTFIKKSQEDYNFK